MVQAYTSCFDAFTTGTQCAVETLKDEVNNVNLPRCAVQWICPRSLSLYILLKH